MELIFFNLPVMSLTQTSLYLILLRIIENAERCVLKAALGACGKEYRWLVSKIWTISLRDDVAAVKKQCYGKYTERGNILL